MWLFHRHDYNIISKHVGKSIIETMDAMGQHVTRSTNMDLFSKKVVHIMKCSKCNKIKQLEGEV